MAKRNAKGQFVKTSRKKSTPRKTPKKTTARKAPAKRATVKTTSGAKRTVKRNPSNSYFIVAVINAERVGGGKMLYYDGFKKFTDAKSDAAYFRKSRAEQLARSIAMSGFSSHVDHIKVMKE